ncbi:MAG: cation:proton antiporter [Bacteroidaceae bacterium]|nr:cation:proton antiporter [Bacteroidaceae bacterium]
MTITDPTWTFFTVLCIILFAPIVFSRLHIPNLVGMILAGVVVGKHCTGLLQQDVSFELFGKVGIYFIMFLAGLEMDMQNLKQNRYSGVLFGLITTLLPFLFGFFSGYSLLQYSVPASLLLACIFASHTLVSYTIVGRYGMTHDVSVTVSVLATVFALLSALLFLAAMAGVLEGSGDAGFWALFVGKIILYIGFMFLLLPHGVRYFFKRVTEPIMQFTFTLAVVFLSAAIAKEFCGLEAIFGAFLSGLVLNRFIPATSPLMSRLEFMAGALFIPYFLIGVGMMINVKPLFQSTHAITVVIIMVVASTLSKLLAAIITRRLLRYNAAQGLMMFGLTEAHAAGALAMVIVGTQLQVEPGVPLMNGDILDGVVLTILISCIISGIVTDQAAKALKLLKDTTAATRRDSTPQDDEKILIPVNNPATVGTILRTAIMMRNPKLNRGLICMNIISDSDLNQLTRQHAEDCLGAAAKLAAAADVPLQTQTRLAVNFATATIHAMNENDASEILIGLHRKRHPSDSFFGSYAQSLIDNMQRQLSIVHLSIPANTIRKIIVAVPPKAQYERGYYRWINRVARIAEDLTCTMEFYTTDDTARTLIPYMQQRHPSVAATYEAFDLWADLPALRHEVHPDHLLVVVTARPGSISWNKSMAGIPRQLEKHFASTSLLIIYPDQQESAPGSYLANGPTPHPSASADNPITRWLSRWITESV